MRTNNFDYPRIDNQLKTRKIFYFFYSVLSLFELMFSSG